MSITSPVVTWDVTKLAEDMACRGWTMADLAARAGVADMTVLRFLRGEFQTNPTAMKIARALGYSPKRYLVRRVAA